MNKPTPWAPRTFEDQEDDRLARKAAKLVGRDEAKARAAAKRKRKASKWIDAVLRTNAGREWARSSLYYDEMRKRKDAAWAAREAA